MMGRLFLCAVLALSTCGMQPAASPSFPDRGRAAVVDAAGVIPDDAERALNQRIVAWDRSTGHQLVVATVPSLQGYDIKDFGYQLGRAWALGRKGQDDGVILLLAPTERKVRIEVGYGLEPVLTDAAARGIIAFWVAPKLKAGQPGQALADGADRIMTTIGAMEADIPQRAAAPTSSDWSAIVAWLVAIISIGSAGGAIWIARSRAKRRREELAAEVERQKRQSRTTFDTKAEHPWPQRPARYVPPTPVYVAPSPSPASDPFHRRTSPPPPAYVSPPPSPAPDEDYWRSPPPSPSDSVSSSSIDWGGSSSSDSGFDSGGGSFGGGGSDSSY